MGNADSTYDEEEEDPHAKFDGIETLGYRVLGVQPDSPASSAGLVSFFDFLVGCDGTMLLGSPNDVEPGEEYDDVDFPLLLQESVGKELTLLVWNIKSQTQRLVKITPSNTWGGTGLLGVTIRLDDYGGADERLVRVLSIEHNSPAAIAGLAPSKDYLLGTTSHSFEDTAILSKVLQANVDRVVEVYVYNTESDVVRVVTLMPTLSWGGMGLLGAEVGTGYLHRLPRSCRSTDGRSFERRVRTGPRPADTGGNIKGTGVAAASVEQDLVNLTAGEGVVKEKIHFEPQMEMEPDPEEEKEEIRQKLDEVTIEEKEETDSIPTNNDLQQQKQQPTAAVQTAPPTAQTPVTTPPANDAAALFSQPPPPPPPPPTDLSSPKDNSAAAPSIQDTAKTTIGYNMAPPPFSEKADVPPPPPPLPAGAPPFAGSSSNGSSSGGGGGLPPPPIAQLGPTNENGDVDLR